MFKKALNSLFSILLVLALLPAPAFAEAAGELTTTVAATTSTETALTANDSASGTEAVSGTVAATSGAATTSEETGPGVAATTNETDYPHKTLDQAVETLTNSFYKPKPRYGVDTNLNTMVAEELRRIGAGEVNVRVTSVQMSSTASYAHAGISTDFATNGSIEYFWMDAAGFTNQRSTLILRQAKVTFELSKDGKTVQYTCNVLIPWDEAKSQAQLADVSQNLAPSYAAGQNESSVTSDFTLPHKLVSADGNQLSWSKVTWTSSDTSVVRIDGYGTEPYKATVTRGIRDKQVTLTANVSLSSSDAPQTSYQKTFTITVPGDSSAIADAQNNLLRRINRRFSASSIKDVYTNHSINAQAVTDDLQMPTPKNFGLDGKRYQFTYTSSNAAITFNGYRGTVYQPLPSASAQQVDITLTVTDKENPEVSVSKTLTVTVSPLNQADIDAELALMNESKAHFWDALATPSGQQNKQDSVSESLATPNKFYRAADGTLTWSYDVNNTDKTASGIVPSEFPTYDPMGPADQARTYSSSQPTIIQNENLVLAQTPEYNTSVTVSALLSSARYSRYASLYPDNEQFQALTNQKVSATFTVAGEKGARSVEEDPDPSQLVSVTLSVVGLDKDGKPQHWAPTQTIEVRKGTTADKATYDYLKNNGLTYDAAGGYLSSITSPSQGLTLATAQVDGAYKWWQFFVNGQLSDKMTNNVTLDENTTITWTYGGQDSSIPTPQKELVINPFAEHPNYDASWSGFGSGNSSTTTQSTPINSAALRWSVTEGTQNTPGFISDQVIVKDTVYYVSGSTLKAVDAATGNLIAEAQIGSKVSYFARPLYVNGMIVVATDDGCLTAFSATTMECIWKTEPLDTTNTLQSVSSLTVNNGTILAEFTKMSGFDAAGGYMVAVDATTGALRWKQNAQPANTPGATSGQPSGYYWSGAAASGSDFMIGDESSSVRLISGTTGAIEAELNLGSPIRAGIVPVSVDQNGNGTYLAVTRNDGTLHLIRRNGSSLVEEKQVKFAAESTSTPTISGSNVFVNGVDAEGYGTISVISLDTFTVTDQARAGKGKSQSTPLVSVQQNGTYAYFTVNGLPGGVWVYKLGSGRAAQIYTPDKDHQNYTTSSVIADFEGNLYYSNDSGTLFSLINQKPSGENTQPSGDIFSRTDTTSTNVPAQDPSSPAAHETSSTTAASAGEEVTKAPSENKTADSNSDEKQLPPTEYSNKQAAAPQQVSSAPTIPLLSVFGFFASGAVLAVFVALLKKETAAIHHVSNGRGQVR